MSESSAAARRLIDRAEHVLVLGHASPDGDCIGALLALGLSLDYLRKPRTLVLPDPVPSSLSFLPHVDDILVAPPAAPAADLIIIPDCSDLARLDPVYEANAALFDAAHIVNIDHHVSNRHFGEVNVVDAKAAAVCEQLFFLLPAMDVPIDLDLATCLLTGIVTDTQTFRTPSTTPRTMRVATALMELGAPLVEITNQVYNSRELSTLRLWGLALSQLEAVGGVVWTHLTEEMLARSGASWEDSEALINLLVSVRTADAALLFKEMADGTIRVSLRSSGKVNVAAVAAHFGGGGHFGAAGCSVCLPLARAQEVVVARVREALAGMPSSN